MDYFIGLWIMDNLISIGLWIMLRLWIMENFGYFSMTVDVFND